MDYDKLAQRIVALGVGIKWQAWGGLEMYYVDDKDGLSPDEFCNDGRVVLALMEKAMCEVDILTIGPTAQVLDLPKRWAEIADGSFARNDSLAVAINHVCCNALEGEK